MVKYLNILFIIIFTVSNGILLEASKFKLKSKSLLERINKLKNYGKKNSP